MGVHYNPGALSTRVHESRLVLYFADRVSQDESNETEVLSDMQRVALGVYAQFKDYLESQNIRLADESEMSPFWENWDDGVCGWQIDVTISQFFDANSCAEPSSFDGADIDSGDVRIYNSETGATVATVNAGGDYGVLVFSGIIDNGPAYTNSIVDNG